MSSHHRATRLNWRNARPLTKLSRMATIYRNQTIPLKELLAMAGDSGDATLLIPDLQRPYIWDPRAVIVLVDSLIRGWPFGTLLTWRVKPDDPARGLARSFWRVVDRTEGTNAEPISAKHPPATFHMVLDGQQRVQSLLLAFAGDGWGFKLLDRRWHEHLSGAKPRGPRGRPHWSLGCLCVDIPALVTTYAAVKRATSIDYTTVLRWVITDDANGQSKLDKPASYKEPLDKASAIPGHYVRLSRLWEKTPEQAGVDSYQAEDVANAVLLDHGIAPDTCNTIRRPLGALLMALKDVKQIGVTYLELGQYEESMGPRTAYNDAIVNIFTRLNTAGRTLTREDITFAWLKNGWNTEFTQKLDAKACFDTLGRDLKDLSVTLSVEDLVAAVSFMWSSAFNAGKLLSNDDLVKGDAIRPMAVDVSEHWSLVREAAINVCAKAKDRALKFREHYQSVYALAYLWAWYFAALRWRKDRQLNELSKDSLDKSLAAELDGMMDRWLICSQWAGVWTSGGLQGFAIRLATAATPLANRPDLGSVVSALKQQLELELRDIEPAAINGLISINADDRDEVRSYYTALWIWNRLDPERWKKARLALRQDGRRQVSLEVDHIVAWNLWQKKLAALNPIPEATHTPAETPDDLAPAVNELGNCMLLEKNFNISKSDHPLKEFLLGVHEFRLGDLTIEEWAAALALEMSQVDSAATSVKELQKLFVERTQKIRADLEQFIRGVKERIDIDSA
jgi:hypothetical protein